ERRDRVVDPRVHLGEPIADRARAVPVLADAERLEGPALSEIAVFLDGGDGPAAVALHEIVAEAVEADLLDEPACELEHRGVHDRVSMGEVRHVTERSIIP